MPETYVDTETVGSTVLQLRNTRDLEQVRWCAKLENVDTVIEHARTAAQTLLARYRLMECPSLSVWTESDERKERIRNMIDMEVLLEFPNHPSYRFPEY